MLHPSLTSWRAQYDRMLRSYARVCKPYISSVEYDDDLQHFFQDCWNLKDWIRNDKTLGIKGAIEKDAAAYESLRIVGDLATACKHLERDREPREGAYVTSTDVTVHLGQPGRPAEIATTVTLSNGARHSAKDISAAAVTAWDEILRSRGLIS